jgi:hypothetical protein
MPYYGTAMTPTAQAVLLSQYLAPAAAAAQAGHGVNLVRSY